jgi:hypothetical protein
MMREKINLKPTHTHKINSLKIVIKRNPLKTTYSMYELIALKMNY